MSDIFEDHPKLILEHLRKKWPLKKQPQLDWLDAFLPAVIAVSTFGGSITFTLIPGQLQAPSSTFEVSTVRVFLSLAWLFFFLAFAFAGVASLVLSFQRDNIKTTPNEQSPEQQNPEEQNPQQPPKARSTRRNERYANWFIAHFPISLMLQILVLLAFSFLGLAVAAYVPGVGWVAVGVTVVAIPAAVYFWCQQRG
jgi:hypothetical protein